MKSYVDLRSCLILYETEVMSSSDEKKVMIYCKSVGGTRFDISHAKNKQVFKSL